jgi:hypothetical protein
MKNTSTRLVSMGDRSLRSKGSCMHLPPAALFVGWVTTAVVGCVFLLPSLALGTPRSARIISIRTEYGGSGTLSATTIAKANVILLRLWLPGNGVTTIKLNRPTSLSSSNLWRGYAQSPSRDAGRQSSASRRWAAASLTEQAGLLPSAEYVTPSPDLSVIGKKLTLNFATSGVRGGTRFFSLSGGEGAKKLKVVRAPHFALANKGCPMKGHLEEHAREIFGELSTSSRSRPSSALSARAVNLSKKLTLRTVADWRWSAFYGANANTRIQTIANAASAIYGNDLAMSLSIDSQFVDNSSLSYPASITNPESFLELFSNQNLKGSANAGVLFTDRTFDDSVIGIAYLGVICRIPSASYAAIRRFQDALDPIILAHEIGHTLSAVHVSDGIMTTSLNPSNPPSSFSASSINEIASHVQTYGSCMASVSPNPNPTPTATPNSGGSGSASSTTRIRLLIAGPRIVLRPSVSDEYGSGLGEQCTFSIKAGFSRRGLFSKGTTLFSSTLSALPSGLVARLSRRSATSGPLYLRGYIQCPGAPLDTTATIWFDPSSLNFSKKTSQSNFLKDLKLRLKRE